MSTDRLYLVAGSLGHRLNEALPAVATLLESDLDVERECVHANVAISTTLGLGYSIYFQIGEKYIESTLEQYGEPMGAPAKTFNLTQFISDTTWAQFACDYITSEVNHFIAMNQPRPTINDLARSQAESEQGFSLA